MDCGNTSGICKSSARPALLNWTLLHNHGAAFSFLSDAGGWQRYFFTSLAGLVSVVFVFWLMRMPKSMKVLPLAVALILGGAIGNLIDRISLGYVVDFIHVYYQNSHFLLLILRIVPLL